jgi:membrane-associated phospholipid phosphatase
MYTGKRFLVYLRHLLVCGLIILSFNSRITAGNLPASDSVEITSFCSSTYLEDSISTKKSADSFYRTDSIFSFRSQKGYFPSLLHNFGEQAMAPLHFRKGDWLITGAGIGITAALIYFDNDINSWGRVQKQDHSWVSKSSPLISELGSTYGICSVIAYGTLSASLKNQKGVQTSLLVTQALITSSLWVHLTKQICGRERPGGEYYYNGTGGGRWYGPLAQFDKSLAIEKPDASFNSFPSGHTATAFSIATVFASQYSDIKAIPVISYSLATLVGISRITENKHWSSDVFAGAVIGYLCGKQVVKHFNRVHQSTETPASPIAKNRTELTIFQYENQVGISLTW